MLLYEIDIGDGFMFEIFKKKNNKVKLNQIGNSGLVKNIRFDDDSLDEVNNWLKRSKVENIKLDDVLLKLGFNLDKKIYLRKISNQDGLSFYYRYDNEEYSDNYIKFFVDFILKHRYYNTEEVMVSIGNCDSEVIYKVNGNYSKEGKFSLDKYCIVVNKKIDDMEYSRRVYEEELVVGVKLNDNKNISFNCKKKFDFELSNELELEKYLTRLDMCESVFEVYKDICEILFINENDFKYFDLTFKEGEQLVSSLSYSSGPRYSTLMPKEITEVKENGKSVSFYRYLPSFYNSDLFEESFSKVVKMDVINGDYKFVLSVKPMRDSLFFMEDATLENELGLRDYFVNLDFPVDIEVIYKKICELSLGDVSRYNVVDLEFYYKNTSVERLVLYDGNFKYYELNKDDRKITIDNEDMFKYNVNDNDRSLSIDIIGNKIKRFEYMSDDGIDMNVDNRIENPIENIINEVKDEKIRVKKLIDKIIN